MSFGMELCCFLLRFGACSDKNHHIDLDVAGEEDTRVEVFHALGNQTNVPQLYAVHFRFAKYQLLGMCNTIIRKAFVALKYFIIV